jgi:hypothetical protein
MKTRVRPLSRAHARDYERDEKRTPGVTSIVTEPGEAR